MWPYLDDTLDHIITIWLSRSRDGHLVWIYKFKLLINTIKTDYKTDYKSKTNISGLDMFGDVTIYKAFSMASAHIAHIQSRDTWL